VGSDKQYDVIMPLDIGVDLLVYGDVRPAFSQVEKLVDDYQLEMGGSACICATQCAKLGLRVCGLGVAGQDALGRVCLDALAGSGVDTTHIHLSETVKTGLGLILNEGEDRAILTYAGTFSLPRAEMLTDSLLSQARHLHLSSLYLMPDILENALDLVSRAKRLGLSVSLDTNWDPAGRFSGLDEWLPLLDIFFPNMQEAQALGGVERLRAICRLLVVKDGGQGAVLYRGDDAPIHQAAFPFAYHDSVGAGDSFAGGFLYGFLQGLPLAECLRMAAACGGMSLRAYGGERGQGRLDEVRAFLSAAGGAGPGA